MDLIKLIEFKNWADEQYFQYIQKLTESQYNEIIPTIHKSVKTILSHVLNAYWGDFHLITDRDWSNPPNTDEMNQVQMIDLIRNYNAKIMHYIENNSITEPIHYQEQGYDKPIQTNAENILFNFVEHNSYHRGQLALLLRYHGFDNLIQVNYNPYLWQKQQT